MTVERFVHAFAGSVILLGLLLALTVNLWFLAVPTFVGLNLLQSSITRFCPLAIILRRLGVPDPVPEQARSL